MGFAYLWYAHSVKLRATAGRCDRAQSRRHAVGLGSLAVLFVIAIAGGGPDRDGIGNNYGEERASRHEDAAEKRLGLGQPEMARRCREDAKLARDTAELNRDALDKLRADHARACPGRDPGACPGRDPGAGEAGEAA